MKTNKKGISLIVLVITIVVMIILATTIILSLTSNDIVDSAKEATNANNLANAKQLVMVAEAEWEMEPEDGTFVDYAKEKLQAAGFNIGGGTGSIEVTEDAKVYMYPVIPAGFTASKVAGENKVSEGLVIIDASDNEYVWVPVENMDDFVRKDWVEDEGYPVKVSGTTSYNTEDGMDIIKYTAMKDSVEKYGGFYISRYEAGMQGSKLISKKGVDVWQNINLSSANQLCEEISGSTVTYHVVYGEQWDAALTFIEKDDPEYITEPAGKGWCMDYTPDAVKSGTDIDAYASNKVKNIYDLSGNVKEMTLEMTKMNNTIYNIARGGSHNSSSVNGMPGFREVLETGKSGTDIGFRYAFYMQ